MKSVIITASVCVVACVTAATAQTARKDCAIEPGTQALIDRSYRYWPYGLLTLGHSASQRIGNRILVCTGIAKGVRECHWQCPGTH